MKKNDYSEALVSEINAFLKDDDWNFSFDEEKGFFKFGLTLKCKIKKVNYTVMVHDSSFTVYAVSPIGADQTDKVMMQRMAEFVCRANYGLRNGNFELDMRDGEIRYKSFVDCNNLVPSREVIKTSIYCPATMFEKYAPGIIEIIFNDVEAKEAVDRCEKSTMDMLRKLLSSSPAAEGSDISGILESMEGRFGLSDEDDED